ncbi:MAG: WG repeat-containing protein [Acidobacteria bacterium]|nr:WG repeat-containing protein [Acidobacteriota bacterium]
MNLFLKSSFFLLFLLGMNCQSHQVQPPPVKPQPTHPKEEPKNQSLIQEQPVPDHLFKVEMDGFLTFFDRTGRIKISSSYVEPQMGGVSEGLCPVKLSRDSGIGYINLKTQLVIPAKFTYARRFSNGLAVVSIGNDFGFIDHSGEFVIPPISRICPEDAQEGFVLIWPRDKGAQYLDLQGNLKIQGKKRWRYLPFSEGVAIVNPPGDSNLPTEVIDTSGKVLFKLQPHLEFSYGFSEGLAPVLNTRTNKYGYVDKTGRVVIPYILTLTEEEFLPGFSDYRAFRDGLALATPDGKKVGFIDKTNKFVIKPQFDYVSPFSEGVAFVRKGNQSYFIDKKGNPVIIPEIDSRSDGFFFEFRNGLAHDKIGFIDKTGKYVWKCPDRTTCYFPD